MSQTYLTENPPMILDATCGIRTRWSRHSSIRMDIRRAAKPDILADARFVPFRDKIFDEWKLDPPHLFRRPESISPLTQARINRRLSGRLSPNMFDRWGWFTSKAQWLDFAKKTADEAARTLKPGGLVRYKLLESQRMNPSHIGSSLQIFRDEIKDSRSNIKTRNTKVHYLILKVSPSISGDALEKVEKP